MSKLWASQLGLLSACMARKQCSCQLSLCLHFTFSDVHFLSSRLCTPFANEAVNGSALETASQFPQNSRPKPSLIPPAPQKQTLPAKRRFESISRTRESREANHSISLDSFLLHPWQEHPCAGPAPARFSIGCIRPDLYRL